MPKKKSLGEVQRKFEGWVQRFFKAFKKTIKYRINVFFLRVCSPFFLEGGGAAGCKEKIVGNPPPPKKNGGSKYNNYEKIQVCPKKSIGEGGGGWRVNVFFEKVVKNY